MKHAWLAIILLSILSTGAVASPLTFTPTAEINLITSSAQNETPADEPNTEDLLRADKKPPRFGTRNSWRWYLQGAYARDVNNNSNSLALAGAGMEYFFANHVSINMDLDLVGVLQEGTDAAGLNFNLYLRWHFIHHNTWSLFLDAGAGMLVTTARVPQNGTVFNFTPQAGGGFSTDIGNNARLFVGLKWQHISNASISSNNPGRDSIMGYAGVSFPF